MAVGISLVMMMGGEYRGKGNGDGDGKDLFNGRKGRQR